MILAGCNTQKVAQDLSNQTGVPTLGTNGLVGINQLKKAIDAAVVYISKNGKLDAGAADAMNRAMGSPDKCVNEICNGQFVLTTEQLSHQQ